jgi:hypothetical protein
MVNVGTKEPVIHPSDDIENGELRWNGTDKGIPKYSGKNLSQCHFIYHKSHMD